jgi:hypothetical protein
LELVETYNECDAMILCSSRKTRPRPFLRTPSTSSSSTFDTKEKHADDLHRAATKNRFAARSPSPKRKSVDEDADAETVAADAKEEDSSSESTSASDTISVASSVHLKKKKSPGKTKSPPGFILIKLFFKSLSLTLRIHKLWVIFLGKARSPPIDRASLSTRQKKDICCSFSDGVKKMFYKIDIRSTQFWQSQDRSKIEAKSERQSRSPEIGDPKIYQKTLGRQETPRRGRRSHS